MRAARNIAIIMLLALIVAEVPGGGDVADGIFAALTIVFMVAIAATGYFALPPEPLRLHDAARPKPRRPPRLAPVRSSSSSPGADVVVDWAGGVFILLAVLGLGALRDLHRRDGGPLGLGATRARLPVSATESAQLRSPTRALVAPSVAGDETRWLRARRRRRPSWSRSSRSCSSSAVALAQALVAGWALLSAGEAARSAARIAHVGGDAEAAAERGAARCCSSRRDRVEGARSGSRSSAPALLPGVPEIPVAASAALDPEGGDRERANGSAPRSRRPARPGVDRAPRDGPGDGPRRDDRAPARDHGLLASPRRRGGGGGRARARRRHGPEAAAACGAAGLGAERVDVERRGRPGRGRGSPAGARCRRSPTPSR